MIEPVEKLKFYHKNFSVNFDKILQTNYSASEKPLFKITLFYVPLFFSFLNFNPASAHKTF